MTELVLWDLKFKCPKCGHEIKKEDDKILCDDSEWKSVFCYTDCPECGFSGEVTTKPNKIIDSNIVVLDLKPTLISVNIKPNESTNINYLRDILRELKGRCDNYQMIQISMPALYACHFILLCREIGIYNDIYVDSKDGFSLLPSVHDI